MNEVQKSLKSGATSKTNFEKESSENALNKVIKNSFRNVIQSEKDKCHLILAHLDESNSVADLDRVVEIGNLINSPANPVVAIRLGSVASNHSRLLKITFLKELDARNYTLSFEKNKFEKRLSILKIRQSMDTEVGQNYKKKRQQVYELNKHATENKTNASFSLRSNGNTAKF